MANTMLASAVAGAMGIVAAPLAQADSTTLVFFIVPALAAALFAGFTSLWIACLAGFAIGIGESLMAWVVDASTGSRPTAAIRSLALQALLTFILLVFALSLRGPACRRAASWSRSDFRSHHGRDGWPHRQRAWRWSALRC